MQLFSPGIFPDISADKYHSPDLTPTPALSSSGARTLVNECPAVYKHQVDNGSGHSRAFDIGTALHTLLLEPDTFSDKVVRVDADSYRTKAAQEARDAARAAGKVPLLPEEFGLVGNMLAAVWSNPTMKGFVGQMVTERTIVWVDRATKEWCKARPDIMVAQNNTLVDLKTATTANPTEWAKKAISLAYHQQAAWYLEGARAIGIPARRFMFVTVSKEAPHLVGLFEFDDVALDYGAQLNRRALDLFHQCRTTGEWPGYTAPDDVCRISLPAWAQNRAVDQLALAA